MSLWFNIKGEINYEVANKELVYQLFKKFSDKGINEIYSINNHFIEILKFFGKYKHKGVNDLDDFEKILKELQTLIDDGNIEVIIKTEKDAKFFKYFLNKNEIVRYQLLNKKVINGEISN